MRPTKAELLRRRAQAKEQKHLPVITGPPSTRTKPYMGRKREKEPDYSHLARMDTEGLGVVYFLGHKDGNLVKIGESKAKDIAELTRCEAHKAYGFIIPLAYVRGGKKDENAIRSYFIDRGGHAEELSWDIFNAESVLPYVTWLRDQYFVALDPEEWRLNVYAYPALDFDLWRPSVEHVSFRRREDDLYTGTRTPWEMLPDRQYSTEDYFTPREIIDPVRQFLGAIDLDPAGHVHANRIIQARHMFTKAQNGLKQDWFGRVWLNPPFEDWKQFARKTWTEILNGHADEVIVLAATRTMTANYFKALLTRAEAVCIITGRYEFWGIVDSKTPPDGHFLMYFGPRAEAFAEIVGGALGPVFFGREETHATNQSGTPATTDGETAETPASPAVTTSESSQSVSRADVEQE